MRIIFFGTPDLAVSILEAVHHSNHEVVLAVTQPDRPKGRSKTPVPPPVKVCAEKLGVPLVQPENLESPEFFKSVAREKADLMLVVAFPILPAELFSYSKCGAVNVHSSLLPKFRGAAPIQWAIAEGEKNTGVTLFKLDDKMDHGGVVDQISTQIKADETAGELGARLMELAVPMVLKNLDKIEKGPCNILEQDHSLATRAPKLRKEDGKIDWKLTNLEIYNRIRAFNPYPVCYTNLTGCKSRVLRIYRAETVDTNSPGPGVALVSADGFPLAGCGTGLLKLLEVQPVGKSRVSGDCFINGIQDKSKLSFS